MRKTLLALSAIAAMAAPSAWATITWEFNPNHVNGAAGSTTQVYTQQGYSITATGLDNTGAIGTPHELFFKNQPENNGAGEIGLGLVNTTSNEVQVNPDGSVANYIQLDLRAILGAGATNGQIQVGSVQAPTNESFRLFGSNTQGALGTQLGGTFNSTFDDQFVAIPSFGEFQFISIAAGSGDVLPVAFAADITPVPEMNALYPIAGLIAAISVTHFLRRRRTAQSAV
jgi:hypothetical protein